MLTISLPMVVVVSLVLAFEISSVAFPLYRKSGLFVFGC